MWGEEAFTLHFVFDSEGRDHEPRNTGSLLELEQSRLLWLLKGAQPRGHPRGPVRHVLDSRPSRALIAVIALC